MHLLLFFPLKDQSSYCVKQFSLHSLSPSRQTCKSHAYAPFPLNIRQVFPFEHLDTHRACRAAQTHSTIRKNPAIPNHLNRSTGQQRLVRGASHSTYLHQISRRQSKMGAVDKLITNLTAAAHTKLQAERSLPRGKAGLYIQTQYDSKKSCHPKPSSPRHGVARASKGACLSAYLTAAAYTKFHGGTISSQRKCRVVQTNSTIQKNSAIPTRLPRGTGQQRLARGRITRRTSRRLRIPNFKGERYLFPGKCRVVQTHSTIQKILPSKPIFNAARGSNGWQVLGVRTFTKSNGGRQIPTKPHGDCTYQTSSGTISFPPNHGEARGQGGKFYDLLARPTNENKTLLMRRRGRSGTLITYLGQSKTLDTAQTITTTTWHGQLLIQRRVEHFSYSMAMPH